MNPRFSILFAVAMLAAGAAFVVHLALRNQNIALGYTVERERALTLRIRSELNTERLELAALRTPAALERLGEEMGMVRPDEVPIVSANGPVRPARSSGRPR